MTARLLLHVSRELVSDVRISTLFCEISFSCVMVMSFRPWYLFLSDV